MPKLQGRQYRSMMPLLTRAKENEAQDEKSYKVEGYAAKYAPYVLYEYEDGTKVYEEFSRDAFNDCDMSDVIFQYNHQGRVYARMSNNTLKINMDDEGMHIEADLSKTEEARKLFEDIETGMVTKMSWGFIPGEYEYIPETRTIRHTKVKKVYDVSAVSIPANDNTEINARSYFEGVIEEANRRELELENKKAKLRLKLKLEEAKH